MSLDWLLFWLGIAVFLFVVGLFCIVAGYRRTRKLVCDDTGFGLAIIAIGGFVLFVTFIPDWLFKYYPRF